MESENKTPLSDEPMLPPIEEETSPELYIYQGNHETLKAENTPFDFANPIVDPGKLYAAMRSAMCKYRGIGLAAPQVGINTRMFVIGDPFLPETCIPCFNPIILDASEETVLYEEGCLSFPGLWIKIKRPRSIRVRFYDMKGEAVTTHFEGLTARTFLHEYDHLDGILFQSRANLYHLEKANKDLKKRMRDLKSNK